MTEANDRAATALIDLALRTGDDGIATVLLFAGRDEYLAFVATWKARHAGVVTRILSEKAFRRDKANPVAARNAAQERRQSLRGDSRDLQRVRLAAKAVSRTSRKAAA